MLDALLKKNGKLGHGEPPAPCATETVSNPIVVCRVEGDEKEKADGTRCQGGYWTKFQGFLNLLESELKNEEVRKLDTQIQLGTRNA